MFLFIYYYYLLFIYFPFQVYNCEKGKWGLLPKTLI